MALVEICTGDPAGVEAALSGGAARVELCSGLAEGGLTPSAGAVRYASQRIHTNVLIRPRPGDFFYSREEINVMADDILQARAMGAQGIVIGALLPDRSVDVDTCRRLIDLAPGADLTFHRAFDLTSDPFDALEKIIALGFRRILTSGLAPTALDGVEMIAELHRRAAGRILIMAGAGVNPENASRILSLSNADELHASARSRISSKYTSGNVAMGSDDDGRSRLATNPEIVASLVKIAAI